MYRHIKPYIKLEGVSPLPPGSNISSATVTIVVDMLVTQSNQIMFTLMLKADSN